MAAADTEPAAVPTYYEPFLAQAALVQQHLASVGEPEVATPVTGPPVYRGTEITRAFAAAADRHRAAHEEQPGKYGARWNSVPGSTGNPPWGGWDGLARHGARGAGRHLGRGQTGP